MNHSRRNLVVITAMIALGSLGCSHQSATPKAPAAVSKTTPPAPLRPTEYVDDRQCAECHAEIWDSYRAHPMGQSMAEIGTPGFDLRTIAQNLDPAHHNPFDANGFRYTLRIADGKFLHRQERPLNNGEWGFAQELPVTYAIGSGRRGQSFVIDRDGYLSASPITWYSQAARWDLSPGYEQRNSEFHRRVIAECLFCHANWANSVPGADSRYRQPPFPRGCAIGCQRCHGPGDAHVAWRTESQESTSTADPIPALEKLPLHLQDAVCQQCHQSGVARVLAEGKTWHDFRPGEPLENTFYVYQWKQSNPDQARFVGHFEQMYASRCFAGSSDRFTCTTCHDPHVLPAAAERQAYYVRKCLQCHQAGDCRERPDRRQATEPRDNCITCHMPTQTTEVQHAATTDHRIRKKPDELTPAIEPGGEYAGGAVRPGQEATREPRSHALTVVKLAMAQDGHVSERDLNSAVETLRSHLQSHPRDLAAWDALGRVAMQSHDAESAQLAWQKCLQINPDHETACANLAQLALRGRNAGQAVQFATRARAADPWNVANWFALATILHDTGQFPLCLQVTTEGAQRFPTSMGLRHLHASCLLQLGQTQAAAEMMAEIEAFHPPEWDKLKRWYDQHPLRK